MNGMYIALAVYTLEMIMIYNCIGHSLTGDEHDEDSILTEEKASQMYAVCTAILFFSCMVIYFWRVV